MWFTTKVLLCADWQFSQIRSHFGDIRHTFHKWILCSRDAFCAFLWLYCCVTVLVQSVLPPQQFTAKYVLLLFLDVYWPTSAAQKNQWSQTLFSRVPHLLTIGSYARKLHICLFSLALQTQKRPLLATIEIREDSLATKLSYDQLITVKRRMDHFVSFSVVSNIFRSF